MKFFTLFNKCLVFIFLFSLSTRASCKKKLKPDISCFIVDMKYDGDSIKIFEFGNIERAGLTGYEKVYGKGKVWRQLWEYLRSYDMPIWHAGPFYRGKESAAFDDFIAKGGIYKNSIFSLKLDPYFKKLSKKKSAVQKNQLKDYKGIILVGGYTGKKKRLIKEFSEFICLNKKACNFVRNKYKTAQLFDDDELREFKPQWKIYPKAYRKNLAKKIIHDFQCCNAVVIKPLNASLGLGVIIVEKKDLDQTLKTIFTNKRKLKKIDDTSYSYWARDKNKQFIVESFEQSKTVTVEGKPYDGTMRMIFVLSCSDGKVEITFLGGFWKFPIKSLDEDGTLTEKHKNKVTERSSCYTKIDPEDMENVQRILSEVLPKVYIKMLLNA